MRRPSQKYRAGETRDRRAYHLSTLSVGPAPLTSQARSFARILPTQRPADAVLPTFGGNLDRASARSLFSTRHTKHCELHALLIRATKLAGGMP